jgi:hypothetical protein
MVTFITWILFSGPMKPEALQYLSLSVLDSDVCRDLIQPIDIDPLTQVNFLLCLVSTLHKFVGFTFFFALIKHVECFNYKNCNN